jgi:hypothetical protein
MKNSMGYLRLLLVLTISMCIDKNLASADGADGEDFLGKKKTDEEIIDSINTELKKDND